MKMKIFLKNGSIALLLFLTTILQNFRHVKVLTLKTCRFNKVMKFIKKIQQRLVSWKTVRFKK